MLYEGHARLNVLVTRNGKGSLEESLILSWLFVAGNHFNKHPFTVALVDSNYLNKIHGKHLGRFAYHCRCVPERDCGCSRIFVLRRTRSCGVPRKARHWGALVGSDAKVQATQGFR